MKRFNEYKEEKIYEGLLGDIYTKVKGAVSYFFDKAKKALLLAISPESIDGYNKGGIRVATHGEELPQVREVEPYYGKEKTSQVEKRNIKAFIAAMSSASGDINEAAVDGFGEMSELGGYTWKTRDNGNSANNPIGDVDTAFVKKFVLSNLIKVSNTSRKHSAPVLLFGAPGVGKTSIVRQVIDAYNETRSKSKKGIISIDCANLGLDSLSLVMPTKDNSAQRIAKAAGLSEEDQISVAREVVTDMVKQWLPCYLPTGNPDEDAQKDAIANGHISVNGITTDGGIIVFDELMRVQDPGVFGQLMNLINDRRLGEWVLGSRWSIVCISNRPNDDKAVANALKNAPSAFFNRFSGCYNVNPDLQDWLAWADGDDIDNNFDFSNSGEIKKRSKRVDPRITSLIRRNPKMLSNIEQNELSAGEIVGATPRSWTNLSEYLWDAADVNGLKDWVLFPLADLKNVIIGIVGKEFGQVVIDSIPEWKKALKGDKSGNDDDKEASQILDIVVEMEKVKSQEELKAVAKRLLAAFKAVGQEKANAIMSAKIAEWGTKTNANIRAIVKVLIKAYPDLEGRFGNYLEKK
jgi:hypothetical protein